MKEEEVVEKDQRDIRTKERADCSGIRRWKTMWKSCSKCGKVHDSNYKCAIKPIRQKPTEDRRLRSQRSWTEKSLEIRERSHYLCQVCLAEGDYTYEGVEVHHIEKLKDDPTKLLDDTNLICLCKHHHELADAGKIDADYLRKLAAKVLGMA